MIGTSPWPRIWRPISNCWSTTSSIPRSSAREITERILVPNTPALTARSSRSSSPGIGFITRPVRLVGEPLVALEEGHHAFSFQRYSAEPELVDLAVHRVLEQDRPEHTIAVEARS